MKTRLFCLIQKLNQMNILHCIYIRNASSINGLYKGQLPILEFVQEHNGCTQRDISQTLQVSPPSIATSIKRLQKAGMLLKVTDEKDQRYSRITVTEKGITTMQACREAFDKVDALMLKGFSKEECDMLEDFAKRMIDNLSTDEFRNMSMYHLINTAKKL